MQPLSLDMVKALFAQEEEPLAVLVTLTADGLDAPLRLTDYPGRISRNRNGLVSRTLEFDFFPFTFQWAGAAQGEPTRNAQIVIGASASAGTIDGRIANAVRTVTGQPVLTVEMVRVSAPDTVEMALLGAQLIDAEINDPQVTGTIRPRDFAAEPACAARYIIARTPSLF